MENIKAIECRFAVYSKNRETGDDIHFVKEQIHNKDGTITPNFRAIKNFKRDFYVARPGVRNHQSKKEWIDISDTDRFTSTQANLVTAAAKALGTPWLQGSLRDISKSPYLYGTDINSTCLVKHEYRKKWDLLTPFSMAAFDTETDVVTGTEQIVMATISFKDKVFTCVQKSFVAGQSDVINRIQKLATLYLGDVFKERSINLEVKIVDSEIDVVKETISKAHRWMPDFLSVWNIEFDMDKIIAACERANLDIKDIMSDPSVLPAYRHFRFKKGAAKKVTASGVVQVFKPSQRWHTVFSPSSFYWIDGMCAYRQIRTGSPEEQSYGLDSILNKHLKRGKLKFEQADHLTGLAWHQFMQTNHPLEYIIYNIFDCIGMEMLDEKTLDLQLSLPMFAGFTDFSNFNSQPRRAVNALHFFALENNKVIASTPEELREDFDKLTTALGKSEDDPSGWIIMLPSHLVSDSGLQVIKENPRLPTNIRAHCGDLDVAAS